MRQIEKVARVAVGEKKCDIAAQILFGDIHLSNHCAKPNVQAAIRALSKASKKGCQAADFRLAKAYASTKHMRHKEGLKMFKDLVDSGFMAAVPWVGELLFAGRGGVSRDLLEAERYLSTALENKSLPPEVAKESEEKLLAIQIHLGALAHDCKKHSEAFKRTLKAAERGHALSQFNVGNNLARGKGVQKNSVEAQTVEL